MNAREIAPVDRFKLKIQKKLLAPRKLKKMGQRQKHDRVRGRASRKADRTSAALPPVPRLAEGTPRSRMRGTMQSSRCDLAWSPRRMGCPGHSHGDAQVLACQNNRCKQEGTVWATMHGRPLHTWYKL